MSEGFDFKSGIQPVPNGARGIIKTADGDFDSDIVAFEIGDSAQIKHTPRELSAREYAAIKLRVPDSGTDWLDAMIKKSLLNEFAANASEQDTENHKGNGHMQEYVEVLGSGRKEIRHRRVFESREIAKYHYAQAMLKASKETK